MSIRLRIALSLIFLATLHAAVIFAGFLAPYDPEVQNRAFPYAPPVRLHFFDSSGRIHLRPFVYCIQASASGPGTYFEDKSKVYPVRFMQIQESAGNGNMRGNLHLFGVEPPARVFLLGTDGFGRDQLSRLIHGGRVSLFSGLLAGGLSLGLGLLLGALAGFYGKWLDEIVMRVSELVLALPWLYCLLALRAFLPLNLPTERTLLLLILVIGLRGWANPARLIRSVALSAKERDYVQAARGFGASDLYLLTRHVLPQTLGVVLVQAALLIPQYTLAEVALSFLGLGVGEPVPTWGNMLASLQHYNVLASYWWMSLPGLILIPVFLGYYTLANALYERFHIGDSLRMALPS
ncbi:MAG TPA: ABC transporter permease [Acidobacteriota bacterium]|nr:ABC transporter permease [Acidobacteriota bacterium]